MIKENTALLPRQQHSENDRGEEQLQPFQVYVRFIDVTAGILYQQESIACWAFRDQDIGLVVLDNI